MKVKSTALSSSKDFSVKSVKIPTVKIYRSTSKASILREIHVDASAMEMLRVGLQKEIDSMNAFSETLTHQFPRLFGNVSLRTTT